MMEHLLLSELNGLIRETIALTLESSYWIVAEINECRTAANGHCYLELIERDQNGARLTAKANAHIWSNRNQLLQAHFYKVTGRALQAGLSVLIAVEIEFHELYGYSLNITDIEPSYTIGDVVRRRNEILTRLQADGVADLNRELSLPRPAMRFAIISAQTAAGYGDFIHQLEQSGYPFKTQLFPAFMQGEKVESSIIVALERIAAEQDRWDAVIIIRGGGATSDLGGFETYDLAANVAQFPLPILVGIGHERDETILDLIAFKHFKTPTAVAAYLIDLQQQELVLLADFSTALKRYATQALSWKKEELTRLSQKVLAFTAGFSTREHHRLYSLQSRLHILINKQQEAHSAHLSTIKERLASATQDFLKREKDRMLLYEKQIEYARPDRILKLGFSITRKNGVIVKHASKLQEGDIVETQLNSGSFTSIVKVKKK